MKATVNNNQASWLLLISWQTPTTSLALLIINLIHSSNSLLVNNWRKIVPLKLKIRS